MMMRSVSRFKKAACTNRIPALPEAGRVHQAIFDIRPAIFGDEVKQRIAARYASR